MHNNKSYIHAIKISLSYVSDKLGPLSMFYSLTIGRGPWFQILMNLVMTSLFQALGQWGRSPEYAGGRQVGSETGYVMAKKMNQVPCAGIVIVV